MIKKVNLIIFSLITLLIIGIIYLYFQKKNEGFDSINSIDIESKYSFSIPPSVPTAVEIDIPYDVRYDKVNEVTTTNTVSPTTSTYSTSDFVNLIDDITVFPASRETYINKNTELWQNFKIKHTTLISFKNNSVARNVNGYFEITFQSCTGTDPFFKFIYNGQGAGNNKITIMNNLPTNTNKNRISTENMTFNNNKVEYPQPNLLDNNSNTSVLNQLNMAVVTNGGLGTNIKFEVVCIKKDGVIYDQFSLTVRDVKATFQLPNDTLNHFYTGVRSLDIYLKDTETGTSNVHSLFDLSTTILKELYLQYEPTRLVTKRASSFGDLILTGYAGEKYYRPVIDRIDRDDWLILGYYASPPGWGLCTEPGCLPLLIKKNPKFVIPATTGAFKWDNKDGGSLISNPYYAHYTTNAITQIVDGKSYNFIPIGDYVNFQKSNNIPTPIALIREDLLAPLNREGQRMWRDKGSGANLDTSIWTYWNDSIAHKNNDYFPGHQLMYFGNGHGNNPNRNHAFPSSVLHPRKRTFGENTEGKKVEVKRDEILQEYTNSIVSLTNKYTDIIKFSKSQIDSYVNPLTTTIKTANDRKNTSIGELINSSKEKYDFVIDYNNRINEVQNTYKNRYNLMNIINTKINQIQEDEESLLNSNKTNLISKIDDLKTSYEIDPNPISSINSEIITASKKGSDLIKQYKYIRKNKDVIDYLKAQVML